MLSPKKDFKQITSIGKAFIEWTTFCRSNTQFEPFSSFSGIQVSFSMYCATSRICSATPDDMDGLLFSLILCFNNKDSNGPLNFPQVVTLNYFCSTIFQKYVMHNFAYKYSCFAGNGTSVNGKIHRLQTRCTDKSVLGIESALISY